MPRIPDKALNRASSVWKLNDVYVGKMGDVWPEYVLPFTYTRQYVKRFVGYSNPIIAGPTTNPITTDIGYTTWGGYSGSVSDCIAFACLDAGGYSPYTDYELREISIFCGGSTWMNTAAGTNDVDIRIRVFTGTSTAFGNIIYDSGAFTMTWESVYSGASSDRAFFMLDLPANTVAPYNLAGISLDIGTTYTVGFALYSPASIPYTGGAFTTSGGTGDYGSQSNPITLSSGAVINYENYGGVTFAGYSGFQTSLGTSGWTGVLDQAMGQLPVLGMNFKIP